AMENVLLPASKIHKTQEKYEYAKTLLELVGLQGKENRLPRQLSGGEQQRIAIARSLVMKPKYIFADEPTGSLDSVSGDKVMKILEDTNQELGTTIVMVTHEPDYAKLAKRQIHLADGKIVC
ncbi:MAG TPA: ATP-binding cassette domain-containing protein, partial [Gammaproteobacteria bacterium]|nr:ATP-binding cassette domain-containing protein [Gammaproteobacteria bacterium]